MSQRPIAPSGSESSEGPASYGQRDGNSLGGAFARSLAWLLLLGMAACAGGPPKPEPACLKVIASGNLNLHDGQPHAVTLSLYPLIGSLGFEQASVTDLLEGAMPPGVAGKPVTVTVGPGEEREFEEAFPHTAEYMGIVADYYRGPGDPEGTRRAVVEADCGWFPPKVTLSPTDLLVN